jgi:tRNA nucleotidyltransferase (CCA-adding enzyme)
MPANWHFLFYKLKLCNNIPMDKKSAFLSLADIFSKAGYNLYLVGGSVRDYLLNKELSDMDVVSDATPEEIKSFFKGEANYVYERFGAVYIKHLGVKFDLTTLRKENSYLDFRHPNKIEFVRELEIDYIRRDFTINAMYLDKDFKLYDFSNGLNDLNNNILRFIGNPSIRIKEDPLRIIRAVRFSLMFSLKIEEETYKAIKENISLLDKLNKDKIKQELLKIKNVQEDEKLSLFNEFNITYLLDMVK